MKPIKGIDAVTDIVIGNWIKPSDLFAANFYPVVDERGEFTFKLTLTLVESFPQTNSPGITIHCINPTIAQWPTSHQILGLAIDYVDAPQELGWEQGYWTVWDFEFGVIKIQCSDVYLTRVSSEALNSMIEV